MKVNNIIKLVTAMCIPLILINLYIYDAMFLSIFIDVMVSLVDKLFHAGVFYLIVSVIFMVITVMALKILKEILKTLNSINRKLSAFKKDIKKDIKDYKRPNPSL